MARALCIGLANVSRGQALRLFWTIRNALQKQSERARPELAPRRPTTPVFLRCSLTSHGDENLTRACWQRRTLTPGEVYTGSLHPCLAEQEHKRLLLLCTCNALCQCPQVLRAPSIDPDTLGLDGECQRSQLGIGYAHAYERRHHLAPQYVVRPEGSTGFLLERGCSELQRSLLVVHLGSAGHRDGHGHLGRSTSSRVIGVDCVGTGRNGHHPLIWVELYPHPCLCILRQRVDQGAREAIDIRLLDCCIGLRILTSTKVCCVLDGYASDTAQPIDIQCRYIATRAYKRHMGAHGNDAEEGRVACRDECRNIGDHLHAVGSREHRAGCNSLWVGCRVVKGQCPRGNRGRHMRRACCLSKRFARRCGRGHEARCDLVSDRIRRSCYCGDRKPCLAVQACRHDGDESRCPEEERGQWAAVPERSHSYKQ